MARVSVPFTVGTCFATNSNNNNNNIGNPAHHFFAGFSDWLIAQGKRPRTVRDTLFYAKKFAYVLDTGDATPIMTKVKPLSQKHVLSALANLSRYQGRYEYWNQIRRNYNLHWVKADSITHFERFFNEQLTLETMLQRIREMIARIPTSMGQIVKFGTLVGARASEVIECVKLINNPEAFPRYYNRERQALEHFRFPDIFLRETKKCYISFVTDDVLNIVKNIEKVPSSRNAIGKVCQRRGIKTDMHLTRKIFASWLRKEGIQPEIIDLLQGRVSSSILVKHYLVPSSSLKDQVLDAVKLLQKMIDD